LIQGQAFWPPYHLTPSFCESAVPARPGIKFYRCQSSEIDDRREGLLRKAWAVWKGGWKDSKGALSTDRSVLRQTQYSFRIRFENGIGSNPEELVAAAHTGCSTMALSGQLGDTGMTASKLETTATVTLEKLPDGFAITNSHLDVAVRVPGADKAKFDADVKAAETGCPRLETLQSRNQCQRRARIL
jgi:osmotically inducible protein OsmC